jgi:uncharacterized protein (UPF0276 family)
MKLAVNYSPQAESLVSDQAVAIDLFKCPTPMDPVILSTMPDLLVRAAACLPIYVHFPLSAGDGGIKTTAWDDVDRLCAQTGTPFVNVHLRAQARDFPAMTASTKAPSDIEQLTGLFISEVLELTARFGADRVIVENVSYRGADGKVMYACVDPSVIAAVLGETGAGLLLDTAHARLTCDALGMDVAEYVAALPLDRLREVHVTGAQSDGFKLRDSMPMGAEDWKLVEWLMAQIAVGACPAPWAVALEYGGVGPSFDWRSDAEVIAGNLQRLRELIGGGASAPP